MRIGGCGLEERHNPNRPTEAPFVRCIYKIDGLEREISRMVDAYVDLQKKSAGPLTGWRIIRKSCCCGTGTLTDRHGGKFRNCWMFPCGRSTAYMERRFKIFLYQSDIGTLWHTVSLVAQGLAEYDRISENVYSKKPSWEQSCGGFLYAPREVEWCQENRRGRVPWHALLPRGR